MNYNDYMLKACLKRYVLSSDLNVRKLSIDLSLSVSPFHNTGAAMLKLLAANVLHLTFGISSKLTSDSDLSPRLVGLSSVIKFFRYIGPIPCRHLCVSVMILNWIPCSTGNQCNFIRHLLMLSLCPFLNVNLAHIFCMC